MTDTSGSDLATKHDWSAPAARRRVRRRYGADRRLQFYGIGAIALAMFLLGVLFASLMYTGYVAFYTTKVAVDVALDASKIDKANPGDANYRGIAKDAFLSLFPDVKSRSEQRALSKIISSGSPYVLRDYVLSNVDKIGSTVTIKLPLSDPFDQLNKGVIPRYIDALGADRIALFRRLKQRNMVKTIEGKTFVATDIFIDPAKVPDGDLAKADFNVMTLEGFRTLFPTQRSLAYREILDESASGAVRERVTADPSLIGKTVSVLLPVASNYAALAQTGESKIVNPRFGSEKEFEWFDTLKQRGLLATPFTWELFSNADSRYPELAGLAGALSGSFYALLVCFLLSFPIGIAAAVYLEEFAPKNKWTDLIEVNINNLAAVPSVVFGLLGLAVFINAFGLPRSAPLVGGMVLALMTLPTIIVATRAALKGVPPSIREAALGVGASKHQVMLHHVIPLALPGILTGTIIGLAQALGETAPLLLIGMNAFIPSIENMGLTQPAMALPTQIFSWADSPERGFVSRTSAAIIVLLCFLVIMNMLAVYLRRKFERKW